MFPKRQLLDSLPQIGEGLLGGFSVRCTEFTNFAAPDRSQNSPTIGLAGPWKNFESPALSRWRSRDPLINHPHAARSLGREPKFSVVSPPLSIALSKPQGNRFVFHHITHSSHFAHLSTLS